MDEDEKIEALEFTTTVPYDGKIIKVTAYCFKDGNNLILHTLRLHGPGPYLTITTPKEIEETKL